MSLRSLRTALFLALAASGCAIPRWPVEGPVTSSYGLRFRGVLPSVHRGVDIAVPVGTEVRAMAPGRVRFAGTMQGYGRVVWLDHGGAVVSLYAHLSTLRVRTGDVVEGHGVVGLSGRSGNAEAAHLHFEIRRWGHQRDPVPLLGGFPGERPSGQSSDLSARISSVSLGTTSKRSPTIP